MFKRLIIASAAVAISLGAAPSFAQLANAWMIPAAANTPGDGGTFWLTDISIHNPQDVILPIVVQFLQSGEVNTAVPTLDLEVYPYETVNLWDVLGPDLFGVEGTGAFLIYVPLDVECTLNDCDFLATSRTFTLDPWGGDGEFGQTIPGAGLTEGTDWWTFGYAAGILNDGQNFRCNIGLASWAPEWTLVQVDVQDEFGDITDTEIFDLPPFGHLQKRLRQPVVGGSLVFYIVDGPSDALIFPYASVVNQETGDPSYSYGKYSGVGVDAKSKRQNPALFPQRSRTVELSPQRQRRPPSTLRE